MKVIIMITSKGLFGHGNKKLIAIIIYIYETAFICKTYMATTSYDTAQIWIFIDNIVYVYY